ncbi:acyl-CoA dehydrogenase [Desulfosarcina alkanivorans]|jgi:alkylation response protein AidB-like acyl-CoA dehydrogenase|uniref:3-methylmercaptopropionyl-CoA dehydrogenase n=1 Tax=Desulfosarcina alkanivorans TaxID=571177 RepID=A0A5K7YN49_9BACT|nr:acyl-CoA dehydrogenase [Desulfosarcina alkanivorans]BBO69805.1 acyl-CoA dehydrogenase [Desulfosarcina alkanivorans]
MTHQIADRRDIDFVLYEQFRIQEICQYEKYEDFNKKMFDMIISEARKLAIKEILPTFAESDKIGATFDKGKVHVPECFKKPYKLFVEGEWTAMTADPELGGQGLPAMIATAASEYLSGANYAFGLYGFEGHAAGRMIEVFGTKLQKELFLKKMYTGEWGGTMDLTEPGAGSDVGALTTTAVKNDDGTYSITGNKIFITSGEQDLTDNIIHPVLARIEGAPAGTKGISLFIVPKIWVNEDGSLGDDNDIVCTGIEEKMGIHGSATCALTYGSKGKCRGLLLGEENKGMKVMFQMMNDARLMVAAIGLNCAAASYGHSLGYARERFQGRALENALDQNAPQVNIIKHPDVRRMLLWMKAHVEAMRSMIYYGISLVEKEELATDEKDRAYHKGLLDFLTPILKAYCTDRGVEVCSEGLQVFGGYGYTKDFPVEQLLRDARIAPIYEGTNGIQAMDLLARKLGMKKGQVFMDLAGEITKTINQAREVPALGEMANNLESSLNRLTEVAQHIGLTAMSEKFKIAFAHACPFLDVMGDVVAAWMLLWRASIAVGPLAKLTKEKTGADLAAFLEKNKHAAFYQGQLTTAQYFIQSILPVTNGKMDAIKAMDSAVVDMPELSFGT